MRDLVEISVEKTAFKEVGVKLDVVGQVKMNKEKVGCMLGARNVLRLTV